VSRPVVIALGSNLGDRGELLADAVRSLDATDGIRVGAVSTFIETPALRPWGVDPDAPPYLNAVALAETDLAPHELLAELQRIEREHGRVRDVRWGDRTLDLDLVDYDGMRLDEPGLTLPHPRAHERDFVLAPWLEVGPEAVLVGRGRVADLLAALQPSEEAAR